MQRETVMERCTHSLNLVRHLHRLDSVLVVLADGHPIADNKVIEVVVAHARPQVLEHERGVAGARRIEGRTRWRRAGRLHQRVIASFLNGPRFVYPDKRCYGCRINREQYVVEVVVRVSSIEILETDHQQPVLSSVEHDVMLAEFCRLGVEICKTVEGLPVGADRLSSALFEPEPQP